MLKTFYVVVIRMWNFKDQVATFERDFDEEPSEQEIADVLDAIRKKHAFGSMTAEVVKRYSLKF